MKKKKDEVPEPNSAELELVRKAIEKKYGPIVSVPKEEDLEIKDVTVSTGCLSLDLALGIGGMAFGRIYEIYGPHSGGKSTLAQSVLVQAQRRGFKCIYVDAEHALDKSLLVSYGAKIKELFLVSGYDGEANLDVLERLLKTGEFKLAVVDSVSALLPRVEAESDIESDQIGRHAKLMSKALRRIAPITDETGAIVIFINQMRMKIGSYGNPETTTGGESLPYYTSGRIMVRGPEVKSRRIVDVQTGEVIGHRTEFEVQKNKLAAPYKKADVNLIYGKGYDTYGEVLNMAVSLGIVDKSGAWYKNNGENFAQGEIQAIQYLKDPSNSDLFSKIRNQVIDQTGLREIYERHGQPGPLDS